ncbi:MAG: 6-phosphofructokinase [Ruminococcaceae bacterium]|nr:6-phosphofructokinase [Oscillospiraceae bacterium]
MGKNLLVGQSGGPTAAINASLAGVISEGLKSSSIEKVYGTRYGVEGIIKENLIDLSYFSDEEKIELLKQTPSAYLGSCRKKLPEIKKDESIYEKIYEVFKKYDIGYFFYIGGNDSMDTVNKLSKYFSEKDLDVKIIGVPKTIDNDLALTDHTPGYGSAARFVANTVKQVAHDNRVYDMESITILEIMGRNAGWLTAAAALANDENHTFCDIICLPEVSFDIDKFVAKIEEIISKKKHVIIAISEGIKNEKGELICDSSANLRESNDGFNHAQLGGAGKTLELILKDRLKWKTRSIELSTLQRCFSVAGSKTDIDESFNVGKESVKYALKGYTGVMIGYVRKDTEDYQIEYAPFDTDKVANFEKSVPLDMITDDGFFVTEKFYEYARPLIDGTRDITYNDGTISTLTI